MPELKHDVDKVSIAFRGGSSYSALVEQAGVVLDMSTTEVYRHIQFGGGAGQFFRDLAAMLDAAALLEDLGAPNAFKTPEKMTAFRKLRAHSKVKVAQSNKTRSEESKAS